MLSIIVPAYNEGSALKDSVSELLEHAGKTGTEFEIIIVNDGSRDDTGAVADGLAKASGKVRVIHNRSNLMIGGAISAGAAAAKYGNIIVSPVDCIAVYW